MRLVLYLVSQGPDYSQVKEGELARVTAVLVDKSTGKVASKYCAKVIVRHLEDRSVIVNYYAVGAGLLVE